MAEIERRHHRRPYYFPATISLGNLLTILVIIGSVFAAYNDATNRLVRVEEKVETINGKLADINAKLGKMNRAAEVMPAWGAPP